MISFLKHWVSSGILWGQLKLVSSQHIKLLTWFLSHSLSFARKKGILCQLFVFLYNSLSELLLRKRSLPPPTTKPSYPYMHSDWKKIFFPPFFFLHLFSSAVLQIWEHCLTSCAQTKVYLLLNLTTAFSFGSKCLCLCTEVSQAF